MNIVQKAGWGDLVADVRLRKVVQEYVWKRFAGLPIKVAREKILALVTDIVSDSKERSLQAIGHQSRAGVKGEFNESGGSEAKPSALDGGADGGSLRRKGMPKV